MAAILDFPFFRHFLCMFFVGLFITHRGHANEENCTEKPSPTILLNLSTQWHFYLLDYSVCVSNAYEIFFRSAETRLTNDHLNMSSLYVSPL